MTSITITWPRGSATAKLKNTKTTRELLNSLPLQRHALSWGDEVYFPTPFTAERECNAATIVPKGAVCFWIDGDAITLPFGPTPISKKSECRLISESNVIGMIDGDPDVLRSIRADDPVRFSLTTRPNNAR